MFFFMSSLIYLVDLIQKGLLYKHRKNKMINKLSQSSFSSPGFTWHSKFGFSKK